jgi:Glycosyltransferase Family 4
MSFEPFTSPSSNLVVEGIPAIVWDGLGLSNEFSGVGSYGANLYLSLKQLGVTPLVVLPSNASVSYADTTNTLNITRQPVFALARKVQNLKPVFPLYAYRRAIEHLSSIPQPKPMVYHGLSNVNLPCFGKRRPQDRFVITIHDIIPILSGDKTALALQMRWLLPRVLERADHVITCSNWAKETILERFGNQYANRITAVGNGTKHSNSCIVSARELHPDDGASDFLEKEFDGLTIARGESYKRLELVEYIATKFPHHQFAVVTDEAGRRRLKAAPKNLACYFRLTSRQLDRLTKTAKVLIHPSLFEGWCLPAADALVQGLHVVYCRGTGIDEVAAYGKEQTTPLPPEATANDWAEAFGQAITHFSRTLPNQSGLFMPNWLDVAQKTLRIYKSLV